MNAGKTKKRFVYNSVLATNDNSKTSSLRPTGNTGQTSNNHGTLHSNGQNHENKLHVHQNKMQYTNQPKPGPSQPNQWKAPLHDFALPQNNFGARGKSAANNRDRDTNLNPSKRQKLSDPLKAAENKAPDAISDSLIDCDIEDDDFLAGAVDEIDQIEIAASQALSVKSNKPKSYGKFQQPKSSSSKKSALENMFKDDPFGNDDFMLDSPSRGEIQSSHYGSNLHVNTNKDTLSLKMPSSTFSQSFRSKQNDVIPSENKSKAIFPSRSNESTSKTSSATGSDSEAHSAFARDMDRKMKELQEQVEKFKSQSTLMEEKYYSRDGEIKILRESLKKKAEEEAKYKDLSHDLQLRLHTQQSEKERDLQKELEKLKTQLQFKEKEVQDAIEKQKKTATITSPKQNAATNIISPKTASSKQRMALNISPKSSTSKNYRTVPLTKSFSTASQISNSFSAKNK